MPNDTATAIPDPTQVVSVTKTDTEGAPKPAKRLTFKGRAVPQNAPESIKSLIRFVKNIGPGASAIAVVFGVFGAVMTGLGALLENVAKQASDEGEGE